MNDDDLILDDTSIIYKKYIRQGTNNITVYVVQYKLASTRLPLGVRGYVIFYGTVWLPYECHFSVSLYTCTTWHKSPQQTETQKKEKRDERTAMRRQPPANFWSIYDTVNCRHRASLFDIIYSYFTIHRALSARQE